MNDRFKFRAFDRVHHQIIDITGFRIENGIVAIYTVDGFRTRRLNEVDLVQSTGLKDKDGTMIFEGDICELEVTVNREDYYMHEIRTGEIKIYSSGVTLKVYKVFDKERNQFCPVFAKYTHVAGYRAKVIGNVHQYKHLLK